jgi:hypothetical protein
VLAHGASRALAREEQAPELGGAADDQVGDAVAVEIAGGRGGAIRLSLMVN